MSHNIFVTNDIQARRNLVDKMLVVADDQHTTFEPLDRVYKRVNRLQIEVVRRLIHHNLSEVKEVGGVVCVSVGYSIVGWVMVRSRIK